MTGAKTDAMTGGGGSERSCDLDSETSLKLRKAAPDVRIEALRRRCLPAKGRGVLPASSGLFPSHAKTR